MAQNGNAAAAWRLAEVTSDIVQRAAAILDEEIAAIGLPGSGTPIGSRSADRESMRILKATRPARAGETVEILTRLQNDDEAESDELFLSWTDLVADAGRHIPAVRVSVTPARLRLPANGTVDVVVSVDVPSGALPGVYRGLIHAALVDDLWAVLTVRIS
jgi:hypothetical protein